jgi:hypothetical protein
MTPLPVETKESPPVVIGGKYHLCINQFFKCDWCSIFNTPQFFDLHKTDQSFYFQLALGSPAQAVGVVHFTPAELGHYRSPRRGTFGSFEFRETLRVEAVEGFVDEVERILRDNGARTIEILEPPAILDHPKAAVMYNILCRKGYQVQSPELDYTLAVDKPTFLEKVEYNLRKRINKCTREGMEARQLDSSLCPQVYEVIARNRAAKGFPMTMTCAAILKMLAVFPDRMAFFGVFASDALVASSICINVGRGMLYVFYWGDLPGYEKSSPISLIAHAIYEYARTHGFSWMGVGTSTKDGIPNYGLINFKREMGCVDSLKLAFVKRVA